MAEAESARAAARARFAHLADEPDDVNEDDAGEVDLENLPMTDADLARLRPAVETAPHLVAASLRAKAGRPRSAAPKVAVSFRLDPDVLGALRASGDGWQGRVNAMLRRGLGLDHPGSVVEGDIVGEADAIVRAGRALAAARDAETEIERALGVEVGQIGTVPGPARKAYDDAAEMLRQPVSEPRSRVR